ncbi:MAG: DUF3145 domain-containing protein [Candidatus Nanopelagicales bacterium]|jgi:hypothetical protein|nr:DUF3145 domain-containing protein [Candidatus Nanopelagicales bacterium]MCU0297471.1 DUF3145 domain-containing protein [Candidatus Nanopelagicales bacterium]
MASSQTTARGVVFIHSCPRALLSHVEWAVQRAVERTHPYEWTAQPIQNGMSRCEIHWFGDSGAAAQIASALRGFPNLRFEITEDSPSGCGERFCFTPTLGMFRAVTGSSGDILVNEQRLRALLDGGEDLASGLADLLGQAWDDELEAFRMAGDSSVRWLTRVG